MSEVFLALTQGGLGGFQKLVAVKLLRRDLAEDEDFRRMFLEEARLTARLSHPNVVQTYDVGEDLGRHYIAMEYLEGQTYERVRRARSAGKAFPLNMQIYMLSQVLAGLHYAHELADYDNSPLAIVHRDVTPSNIFISYDGQVKLVDFGIAKVLDSLNQTKVGVLKGKARYMAPEQIAGSAVDRRADLFSVGAMLWEMLSGTQIWLGRAENEILRLVSSGELPVPPRDAPATLQQICSKAMAFRASDRYATAGALRNDLESYLAQQGMSARDPGLGTALTELFREERAQIRQLIETQLRGSRPSGLALPTLREARTTQTSDALYAASIAPDQLAAVSGGQSSYSSLVGQPRSRRKLPYVLGGLAVAVALAGVIASTRNQDPATAASDGSRPAASAVAASAVAASAVPPTTPEAPATAPPVAATVRGVTDTTILLGMSAAFSGSARELGTRMKLGLDTAFAVINEGGGIAGRTIKLLALDDGYEGKRTLANVQELLTDRGVFAIIGNVGTPTTKEALPYVLSKKVLFFGAFTGAGLLRRDPPDRYVFNYRASYEDETAKMINYLLDVKKIPDSGIVVFAQNDSYGDAGYDGATKMLRKRGRGDDVLRVGYERNTVHVDDAVNKIIDYHTSTMRVGDAIRPRHPVDRHGRHVQGVRPLHPEDPRQEDRSDLPQCLVRRQ
jgi:serine/threonine protein kinase